MPRRDWDSYYMQVAHTVKTMATCDRKAVGAVLVDRRNRIVATGFNGAPSGLPHCCDVGCIMDDGNHCVRVIHAETNAILEGMKRGEIEGSTMYVTVFPCMRCLALMIQGGVRRVVYDEVYRSKDQLEFATTAGVELQQDTTEGPNVQLG